MKYFSVYFLFVLCMLNCLLTACDREEPRYVIGVSQCSDDEWRTQMNKEIRREALFIRELKSESVRPEMTTGSRLLI